jgi:hypothetical protein
MDIWNTGQPLQQVAGADEASSRPTGPEELTSQLPVHMVVPGTEPNMQSERLRVAMPNAAAEGRVIASTAAAAAAAAGADDVGGGGDDMFADDDDMFGEGGGGGGAAGVKRTLVVPAGLMDNYDDPEGYYNFQVGGGAVSRQCAMFLYVTQALSAYGLKAPMAAFPPLHAANSVPVYLLFCAHCIFSC